MPVLHRHRSVLVILSLMALVVLVLPARAADRPAMVAAAHPLAVAAGAEILAEGGTAVDAAVAIQAVLGLVEPQSSGIGGGAFMLVWDARFGTVRAYDGRETAPASATEDLFLGPDGSPMTWIDAVIGGRSVGVPGVVRMLDLAHRRHGRLAWARLWQPAIRHARIGFTVTPRLHEMLLESEGVGRQPAAAALFFGPDGAPWPVGTTLRNPAYAETLGQIASQGPDAFYSGPIAHQIVEAVHTAPDNPGLLSLADLAGYEARARDPVCRTYRGHTVCGMPPPTSGGVAVLMMLGLLERFDMANLMATDRLTARHLLAEAGRVAFADRNRYLADPDFVDVPVAGLLDDTYLAIRSRLLDPAAAGSRVAPGIPGMTEGRAWGRDASPEMPSTTHFAVVDHDGNAVSMTSSVERAFGSGLVAGGFILNNQLTDFSFAPRDEAGRPIANRVAPGKRPRSSMSPMIVLDKDGAFLLATGSPGGSRIIGYTARSLVDMLDGGMSPQQAAAAGHVVNRGWGTDVERDTEAAALAAGLEALGHDVTVRAMTSGLHIIRRLPDGSLVGGADPRREGTVLALP